MAPQAGTESSSSPRKSLVSALYPEQLFLQLDLPHEHSQPVLHSPVVLLARGPKTTHRHLFLFRNWLVITKQRSAQGCRFKQKLHLSGSQVVCCDKEEGQDKDKDHDLIFTRGNSLFFMMALDPCVTEFPHSQSHTRVKFITGQSAQSLMKLISSCHAPKTLNANNMETLIECQSEGDIKDHPLLASFESEDSICQLVEVKKRKKVLSWPFLMRRLSPSSDFSGALEPELKVSLFDQPLSIICGENDTLPRPIQDILTILCLKGPSTEGVFRKAANEKARKELKEGLNSGGAVDLEGLPVHLLAVVLKDFLRSIPLKLLSCDLFEEWMGALEKQKEEDRIEALKQVADKLPRPNLLLLKHVVSVLYLISRNSEVSKMDASNLAICVGPNMLTRDSDQDLSFEAQKDLNNKIKTLVEFLIDNCLEIFGENIPAKSSITSDDSLEHTDSSDASTPQNDSAYDSNDPDVEASSVLSSQVPAVAAAGTHIGEPISTVARLGGVLRQPDRRHSEPGTSSSRECLQSRRANQKLTKSQDDFTRPRAACRVQGKEPEDPFPEEAFAAVHGTGRGPGDLKTRNLPQGPVCPRGPVPKAFSSGSLDGSSDSSPVASPSSPKRNFFTRHQSFTTKTEKSKPNREIKKHSMSFSLASHKKLLSKAPSAGSGGSKGFPRDQAKKDVRKDSQLAGRVVQEHGCGIHSQAAPGLGLMSCALLVDEVFQQVDQRSPGSPPSYAEAILGQASGLAAHGSQTVASMRARVLGGDSTRPPLLPPQQGGDTRNRCSAEPPHQHRLSPMTECWKQSRTVSASEEILGHVTVPGRPELHRLRTASESLQKNKQDYLRRQCSQPLFDAVQLQYAKESYI